MQKLYFQTSAEGYIVTLLVPFGKGEPADEIDELKAREIALEAMKRQVNELGPTKDYVTPTAAAEILGVNVSTLYRRRVRGEFTVKIYKLGKKAHYYKYADIIKYRDSLQKKKDIAIDVDCM